MNEADQIRKEIMLEALKGLASMDIRPGLMDMTPVEVVVALHNGKSFPVAILVNTEIEWDLLVPDA